MSDQIETPAHLGGAIPQGDSNTFMPDIWGYLLVKYELKLMFDLGCGYGHAMKWFAEQGVVCRGVDGWKEAIENTVLPGCAILHDFTTGPYLHGHAFDLCWCAEFLEHVDEKYLPNIMPIFQGARVSVITHGEPRQHGHHHVNCQTSRYWVDKFYEAGLWWDEEETALLRRTDRKAPWGRRTLMVFKQR